MNDTAQAMKGLAEMLLPMLQEVQTEKFGRGYGSAWSAGLKHDAGTTPQSSGYSHGPGGNLTYPGVDPLVFSAMIGAKGLLAQLPAVPSVHTNPVYEIITGVRDRTGDEKDGVCDNAPVAGLMKTCKTTSVFGRYENSTPILEVNRLGARVDRADPMDLTMVGSPIAQTGIFGRGPGNPDTPAQILQQEVARKFWELGIAFHRQLSLQLWAGNPANNSAGGGYKEMTSFPLLVNDGYVDAETGVACAAVDSTIEDFGGARIDQDGTSIVALLSYLYYIKKDLAMRSGVDPVRFVFAMRPELFWELTALWPCSYLTYQCQVTGNQRVNINAADQVRMRDEMRAGMYLLINGDRVEVVTDDGIPFTTNTNDATVTSGCFESDIYLIPMSIQGGRAVTFLEYFDFGNPDIAAALAGQNMILGRVEGAFITFPRQTNQCIQWQSKIEPRLVMRTPWLAARLQNVEYCPTLNPRQPFPTDPYFVNGGDVSRQGPSLYNQWQQ